MLNEKIVNELIKKMTLEEKVGMLHGAGLFRTEGVKRLGIPPLKMSDGPMGVRHEFYNSQWLPIGNTDDYSSYLPCNSALASTWNKEILNAAGKILGSEARGRGKDIILASGINIMRSPLCGRNFEYMSEDPYLAGELIVPFVKGIQEYDVAACVKHFALNNQETERLNIDVQVSERALREIYLPAFEQATKVSYSLMTAYNKIRGEYCSHSKYLLRNILMDEWMYDGVIISDWGAVHDTKSAANAGLDIEMSVTSNFDEYFFADKFINSVKNGDVKISIIDEKVKKIIQMMDKINIFSEDREGGNYNSFESRKKILDIARESIILLKNKNNILPLETRKIKKIAIIGENANLTHSNGGGSAEVKALYEITPLMGLKMKLGGNIKISYCKGYSFDEVERAQLKKEAIQLAKESDVVIFVGGLKHTKEDFELFANATGSTKDKGELINIDSEGVDKTNMLLPYEQNELISELLKVNEKTLIVISTGSPVEMTSWVEDANAIIQTSYNGMEGGVALAEVILGEVNPSGKLTVTIPKKLEDSPAHKLGEFPGKDVVKYNEDIFVGYRYFSSYGIKPLFPFGYGLSYTDFKYENLKVDLIEREDSIKSFVSFDITNTGNMAGAEIAQIYISPKGAKIERPSIELKGFEKVYLKVNETKRVSIELDEKAYAFYSLKEAAWVVENGEFDILVGAASDDFRLKENVVLKTNHILK